MRWCAIFPFVVEQSSGYLLYHNLLKADWNPTSLSGVAEGMNSIQGDHNVWLHTHNNVAYQFHCLLSHSSDSALLHIYS